LHILFTSSSRSVLIAACALAATAHSAQGARPQDPVAPSEESAPPKAESQPLQHFEPFPSRWYAPGYTPAGIDLTGYEINEAGGDWRNPYRQNPLKGDFPILGSQDVFLNIGGLVRQYVETRNVPTGTLNTGDGGFTFFGNGRQSVLLTQVALSFDLFKGAQAFQPVDWRLKLTPVVQRTEVQVEHDGVLFANPARGDNRVDEDIALQEALFEYHIADLSANYDFVAAEVGILPFRSDFRGFVFDDVNMGARLFGNWDSNRWQYNLVFFDMLDKDTNSGLNRFEDRSQSVAVANVYRQDWPVDGFTSSASVHFNYDDRGVEFDDNGGLVSPAPIGAAQPNTVESYYLGLAGEGHFGRWNTTVAAYQALGSDSLNPIAAQRTDIDAQFAALEVSYDIDWVRVRGFGLYASGDPDPRDSDAEGFDAILDSPNFAGGSLSFFNGQALRLLGVNLTNAGSPLPDLQSSQTQGKSNFVNPGLIQLGGALDFELTPRWRAALGGSYLMFDDSASLETFLELPEVEREIGTEFFLGMQYRPLLDNHLIFSGGASMLLPGDGFARIYQSDDVIHSVFINATLAY